MLGEVIYITREEIFMSKYQTLKDAIEAFQPGGSDAPILYASTEVNEKAFKVLAGRKLKLWTGNTTILMMVCFIFLAVVSVFAVFLNAYLGAATPAPTVAAFMPFIVMLMFRTTFSTITDDGLNIYFIEYRFGSKYVISDKLSLPYDSLSNVKVRVGKILRTTNFTFEFLHNNKKYRIRTSVPNRKRKMQEQEGNLKYLLEILEKKGLINQ